MLYLSRRSLSVRQSHNRLEIIRAHLSSSQLFTVPCYRLINRSHSLAHTQSVSRTRSMPPRCPTQIIVHRCGYVQKLCTLLCVFRLRSAHECWWYWKHTVVIATWELLIKAHAHWIFPTYCTDWCIFREHAARLILICTSATLPHHTPRHISGANTLREANYACSRTSHDGIFIFSNIFITTMAIKWRM